MSVTAGTLVTTLRDLIPDTNYDASGVSHPELDGGLFRGQTLYRWLNDGVKALTEQVGWVVSDWTAVTVTANQPFYSLNGAWHELEEGFQGGFRLMLAPEGLTVWPKPIVGAQAAMYTIRRQTDHLEVGLLPIPNTTDPTTTINQVGGMTLTSTSVTVTSTTGFLTFGYVQIDSEILAYQTTTATSLGVLTRAQAGTAAATHANGATVTHLSAWFKGERMPTEIAVSTDVVEVPSGFLFAVQEYVLSKCDYAQNDVQAGKLHMDQFRQECKRIHDDPGWRSDAQGTQVLPYGQPLLGRTIWGPFGVYVK
jgi:hypothetical protein